MVEADRKSYQTVYARSPGAVAAPTAGLHFTEKLLRQLEGQGTTVCWLTLHVGPGTFRLIDTHSLGEHRMHAEWASLRHEAVEQIEACRRRGGGGVGGGGAGAPRGGGGGGAGSSGIRRSDPRGVPLLQLRRRDVDPLTGSGHASVIRAARQSPRGSVYFGSERK